MAMTIVNNLSAQLSLNQLNRNDNSLKKSLRKVSTGQRIVGAGDNASDYGISEKMRVQIRALDQDVQNVQNGSTMLKIAHGGIQEIVNNLRAMKELAINAANDSNTDADRAIIQKEFDQRRAAIDDIATWTNYNTKSLLDGSYKSTLNITSDGTSSGTSSGSVDPFAQAFVKAFSASSSNCIKVSDTRSGYGITGQVAFAGDGRRKVFYPAELTPTTNIYINMDFSDVLEIGDGFSILCGGCTRCINIKFDPSVSVTSSSSSGDDEESSNLTYTIGTLNVKRNADLAKAIFQGVTYAKGLLDDLDEDNPNVLATTTSLDQDGLDGSHRLGITEMGGKYYIRSAKSPSIVFNYGIVEDPPTIKASDVNDSNNGLTIHHGAHANQSTNFYINDMHSNTLGINLAEVTTRSKAIDAIFIIDYAIEYAIDQATNIGSYLQRLEYTESNVNIANENTQGAESTIRDADMAKEMTEYTKFNVLSQAAQSMLAQANQNTSGVLSLLQ